MSAVSAGSGPRQHYFNIVFGGTGQQQGVISRIVQFPHARVTSAQLEAIRNAENIDHNAPLLGVHYMGRMTQNQWEKELWEVEQATPVQSGCRTSALVGLSILLAIVAIAASWYVLH